MIDQILQIFIDIGNKNTSLRSTIEELNKCKNFLEVADKFEELAGMCRELHQTGKDAIKTINSNLKDKGGENA